MQHTYFPTAWKQCGILKYHVFLEHQVPTNMHSCFYKKPVYKKVGVHFKCKI